MEVLKQLIPPGKFALALSGGYDSVAAALWLKTHKYDFVAFHFNNKMIPYDDQAQENVEWLCEHLKVPLHLRTCEFKYKKGSKEEFARVERHAAFSSMVHVTGINHIVLAQNLDDAIISYLWNCLRGHPDHQPMPLQSDFGTYGVWRPFILCHKSDLKKVIAKNVAAFAASQDPMNEDPRLNRNFIRDELLPVIHSRNYNLYTVVAKIIRERLATHGIAIAKGIGSDERHDHIEQFNAVERRRSYMNRIAE